MFVIISIFCSTYASAGVYKCTDSDGKTTYQPQPCDDKNNAAKVNLLSGSETNLTELEKKQALKTARIQEQHRDRERAEQQIIQQQKQLLDDAIKEGKINQELIKNSLGKFSAYSFPPYTKQDRPALVDNFAARLPEIERFRRQAALLALARGKCDRVEASELNIKSTRNNLMFLIDCSNAERIYLSEKDLLAH